MTHLDVSPLFQPIRVGTLTLPNRFVLPAMQRGLASDGDPIAVGEIYRTCAEGGVGLVIGESTAVDHWSANWQPKAVRIEAGTLQSWKEVIDGVKSAGGNFLMQLWHPGAQRVPPPGETFERESLSPSGLAAPDTPVGRPMTADEMGEIKRAFVQGAVVGKGLGADGVEVHCAHGYLLDQFLWRATNHRTDGYGGDNIVDRVRFPAELVTAIRAAVGPDFPISLRFSQWKRPDMNARTVESPEELELMLGILRDAGVDIFHASTRRFDRAEWPGSDLGLAGWAEAVTDAPIIAVGSVGLDADQQAELRQGVNTKSDTVNSLRRLLERFERGDFDLISVGRAHLADGAWVTKVKEGRFDDIEPYNRGYLLAVARAWNDGPGSSAHQQAIANTA